MNKKLAGAIALGFIPGLALAVLLAHSTKSGEDPSTPSERIGTTNATNSTSTTDDRALPPQDAFRASAIDREALGSTSLRPQSCDGLREKLATALLRSALDSQYPSNSNRSPQTTFAPPRPLPTQARPAHQGAALLVDEDQILAIHHGALVSMHIQLDKLRLYHHLPLQLPQHFADNTEPWRMSRIGDTLILLRQGDFLEPANRANREVFYPRPTRQTQIAILDVSIPKKPRLQKLFRSGELVDLIKTPRAIYLLTRDQLLIPKQIGQLLSRDTLGDPDSSDSRPAPTSDTYRSTLASIREALSQYEQDHPERPIIPTLQADNPHFVAQRASNYTLPTLPDPCQHTLLPTDPRALQQPELVDVFTIKPDGSLTLERLLTPALRTHPTSQGVFLSYQARGLETAEIGWREQDASFFWKIDQPDKLQLVEGELLGLARTPKHLLALHTVLPPAKGAEGYFMPEQTRLTLDPLTKNPQSIPAEPGSLEQRDDTFLIHPFPTLRGARLGHITAEGKLSDLLSPDETRGRWHLLSDGNVLQVLTGVGPHSSLQLYHPRTGKPLYDKAIELRHRLPDDYTPTYHSAHKLLGLPHANPNNDVSPGFQFASLTKGTPELSIILDHEDLLQPFPYPFRGKWRPHTQVLGMHTHGDRLVVLSNLGLSLHATSSPDPILHKFPLAQKFTFPRMREISFAMRTYDKLFDRRLRYQPGWRSGATDPQVEPLMRPLFMSHSKAFMQILHASTHTDPRRIYALSAYQGISSRAPKGYTYTYVDRQRFAEKPATCCWLPSSPNEPSPYDWEKGQLQLP